MKVNDVTIPVQRETSTLSLSIYIYIYIYTHTKCVLSYSTLYTYFEPTLTQRRNGDVDTKWVGVNPSINHMAHPSALTISILSHTRIVTSWPETVRNYLLFL